MLLSFCLSFLLSIFSTATGNAIMNGTFIQLSAPIASWSQAQWEQQLQWMTQANLSTVILQYVIDYDQKAAFYPTSITGYTIYGNNPIHNLLTLAPNYGVTVWLGLALSNTWFNNHTSAYLQSLTNFSCQVVTELNTLYKSQALKGIYIPQEVDNLNWVTSTAQNNLINNFFVPLTTCIKSANSTYLTSTSPFFNDQLQSATDYGNWWLVTLNATLNLDVIILQDGIGAGHATVSTAQQYFTAIGSACANASPARTFWAEAELYQESPLTSASLSRIQSQLTMESPLASSIIGFDWEAYLSPSSGSGLSLYLNYSAYVHNVTTPTDRALTSTYSLSPSPSSSYPDSTGTKLTDGTCRPLWADQVGWLGVNPSSQSIVISIDLTQSVQFTPSSLLIATFFVSTESAVPMPSQVQWKSSANQITWTTLGSGPIAAVSNDALNSVFLSPSASFSGRYLQIVITPANTNKWTMVCAVDVYI